MGWGNENRLAGGRDGKGSESRLVDVKVEMGLVQAIGRKGGVNMDVCWYPRLVLVKIRTL